MSTILEPSAVIGRLASLPVERYGQGELVLAGGSTTGKLLIMTEGAVEVVRAGVCIAEIAEPGAVFGDLAVLLDQPHSADVRTVRPSTFYVADGRTILRVDPTVALYVAVVLAQRLETVDGHLVEARRRLAQTDQPGRVLRETLDDIGRTLQYGPPL
jgi:CRP-like cAMP-binding protein